MAAVVFCGECANVIVGDKILVVRFQGRTLRSATYICDRCVTEEDVASVKKSALSHGPQEKAALIRSLLYRKLERANWSVRECSESFACDRTTIYRHLNYLLAGDGTGAAYW